MKTVLDDYFAALNRLKMRRPTRVSASMRISNDSVALEAGRGKGSIKKSRPMFVELIAAIDEAAIEQAAPVERKRELLLRTKESAADYRLQYEAALARELSLLREIYALKQQLAGLTGAGVYPLRGK